MLWDVEKIAARFFLTQINFFKVNYIGYLVCWMLWINLKRNEDKNWEKGGDFSDKQEIRVGWKYDEEDSLTSASGEWSEWTEWGVEREGGGEGRRGGGRMDKGLKTGQKLKGNWIEYEMGRESATMGAVHACLSARLEKRLYCICQKRQKWRKLSGM